MKEIPLHKLADTITSDVETIARVVKIELFNGVIRDTRVKTGRLRGNWQTTTGEPADGVIVREDDTPQGSDGGAAQAEVIRNVKGDTVDWITNNLAYAEPREEKDGMISRNVARIDRYVKEQIAKHS